jgi:hypothetical protein
MTALAKIKMTNAAVDKAAAAPVTLSKPKDQARVKKKLETLAESAVDLVKSMVNDRLLAQAAAAEADLPPPLSTFLTKDEIAIIEHTSSNAIRVFNLGLGAKHQAPLDDKQNAPAGLAGLKLLSMKKEKAPASEGSLGAVASE